jgi:hypothetical protein
MAATVLPGMATAAWKQQWIGSYSTQACCEPVRPATDRPPDSPAADTFTYYPPRSTRTNGW